MSFVSDHDGAIRFHHKSHGWHGDGTIPTQRGERLSSAYGCEDDLTTGEVDRLRLRTCPVRGRNLGRYRFPDDVTRPGNEVANHGDPIFRIEAGDLEGHVVTWVRCILWRSFRHGIRGHVGRNINRVGHLAPVPKQELAVDIDAGVHVVTLVIWVVQSKSCSVTVGAVWGNCEVKGPNHHLFGLGFGKIAFFS